MSSEQYLDQTTSYLGKQLASYAVNQGLGQLGFNTGTQTLLGSAVNNLVGPSTAAIEAGTGAAAATSGLSGISSALGWGGLAGLGYSTLGDAIGLPQGQYSGLGASVGGAAGSYAGTALGTAAGSALSGTTLGATLGSIIPVVGTILGAVAGGWLGSELGGDDDPPEPHSHFDAKIGFEDGRFQPMTEAHTYVRGLNSPDNLYTIKNPEYDPDIPKKIRNPEFSIDPRTGAPENGPRFIENPKYEPEFIQNPDFIDLHEHYTPGEQQIIDATEQHIDRFLAEYTNKFNRLLSTPSVDMGGFNPPPMFEHRDKYHGTGFQKWFDAAENRMVEPLNRYKSQVQNALEQAGLYTNLQPLASGMQAGPQDGYLNTFQVSRNPEQDTLLQVLNTLQ